MTVTELDAIPNPPNKRSRYDFQLLPTKRATHNSDSSQQKKPNAKPYPSQQKGPARSQPFSIANLCSFRSAVQLQNLIGFLELHHIDLLDRLVNGHSAPVHNAGEDE